MLLICSRYSGILKGGDFFLQKEFDHHKSSVNPLKIGMVAPEIDAYASKNDQPLCPPAIVYLAIWGFP